MYLSDIAIRRPVLATVASLLLVVLGVSAYSNLPVREYPDIDRAYISISTVYAGASAQVVEREVTRLLEAALGGVNGIDQINSSSRDQRSWIGLEFNDGQDIETAANDVRNRVARAARRLPDGVDAPVVSKSDANARAMMWVGMSGAQMDTMELTGFAERFIVDKLSVLPGVASVRVAGVRRPAIRIWLRRSQMAARNITVSDITTAIEKNNVELPAGTLRSLQRELPVRVDSSLNTAGEFAALVIAGSGQSTVRLADVAGVELSVETDTGQVRANGVPVISIGIVRQSRSNTLAVAEAVRDELQKLKPQLPPGIGLTYGYDESLFILDSLQEVLKAMLIAVALVIILIFLFLRSWRATLIPALAIPVSIIATLSVFAAFGYSINVLTLLALVLAIGLVVDDAIVVLENIHRRIEAGEAPRQAAINGARQITFAVIATTVVLVAVFVPLSFLQGSVGRLFGEFGISLASAVIFSSFVALTLSPMMCSRLLRATDKRVARAGSGGDGFYARALNGALKMRWLVVLVTLSAGGAAYWLYGELPRQYAPQEDRAVIYIPVNTAEGSSLEYTDAKLKQVEKILDSYRDAGEIGSVFAILASNWGGPGRTNRAFVIARLVSWQQRERSQREIAAEIAPKLKTVAGISVYTINPGSLGQRSDHRPLRVVIGGPDYPLANAWAEDLKTALEQLQGLSGLRSDYNADRPELRVSVDRQRAADLGVNMDEIAETVEIMLASKRVSRYIDRGREYAVIMQAQGVDRDTPDDIENMLIRIGDDTLVSLDNLVTMREVAGSKKLRRVDRLPSVTISASLEEGYDLGRMLDQVQEQIDRVVPDEAAVSYSGLSRLFLKSSGGLTLMFVLALLIVYLALAAQFESFVYPLVILVTVPLAVAGGMLALYAFDLSLNIYSQIGMLLLIGLVAKNGILIVEFANQLRGEGETIGAAIRRAALTRARPIVMTSCATVIGAIPLALSSGAGAEARTAMASVIIGGILPATLMTLLVIPAMYSIFSRWVPVVQVHASASAD